MNEIPDTVCCDLFIHLLEFIRSNKIIAATGVKFGLRFYDGSAIHPILIGHPERPDAERSLFKRWEMTITGADYETLDLIVAELQSVPPFMEKPVLFFSES